VEDFVSGMKRDHFYEGPRKTMEPEYNILGRKVDFASFGIAEDD
jgi:hypothetical protein